MPLPRTVVADRRTALRWAGGAGLTSAIAAGVLGCSDSSPSDSSTGPDASSPPASPGRPSDTTANVLPAHQAYSGVTPDVAPKHELVLPGYYSYPEPPIDAVPGTPGKGSKISVMLNASVTPTPAPLSRNAWWQYANQQLGVTLDMQLIPGAQMQAKFTTLVAGDDLPDIATISEVPNLKEVLKARFADLSEHLSGDAVNEYPMLANFPTSAWRGAAFGDALYGIPWPNLMVSSRLEARADILEKIGHADQLKEIANGDDFLKFCQAVTDASAHRWALVQPTAVFVKQMIGVPNQWSVADDGAFTKDIEAPQYPQWLSFVKKLWDAKVIHPDAFSHPQVKTLFEGGQFMLFQVGGEGFTTGMASYSAAAPGFKPLPVAPQKFEGGGLAPTYLGPGYAFVNGINKKASASKIKEMLSVLNYLAAPFGTKQYLLAHFGKPDVDYTWKKGVGPVQTKQRDQDMINLLYLPGTVPINYSPGYDWVTKQECEYAEKVAPNALPLPTAGLYSSTDSEKGASLTKTLTDATNDIIQGRKPVSAWDGIVKTWRQGGGDTIRSEYEKAYAAANG